MNLFSISCIILFVASIGFGLLVYAGNRKGYATRAWLWLSLSIATWSLALYQVTAATTEHQALLWQFVLDISAISIPMFLVLFAVTLTRRTHPLLSAGFIGTALGIIALSFTSWFKLGVAYNNSVQFFWVVPGPLYTLFPAFFTIGTLVSMYLLIKTYRTTTDTSLLQGRETGNLTPSSTKE